MQRPTNKQFAIAVVSFVLSLVIASMALNFLAIERATRTALILWFFVGAVIAPSAHNTPEWELAIYSPLLGLARLIARNIIKATS